jgi:transcriptional regulator with XRE-family HTH domain
VTKLDVLKGAMKLSDYISQRGHSASKLARKMGVFPSTITRLASGDAKPSYDMIALIGEHTDYAVRPDDFFNDINPPSPF